MYDVTLNGITRQAEFTVDMAAKKITRTYLHIEDGAESAAYDVVYATIQDKESMSNLKVTWVVLCGTKDAIISAIETELPVAKLEADAIFDAFKDDECEPQVCYTYPLTGTLSKIMQRSPTYQALSATQKCIIASMWELPAEQVRVLVPQYS